MGKYHRETVTRTARSHSDSLKPVVCSLFVCVWRESPQCSRVWLIHEVSRSHTTTHHSR